MFNFDEFEEMLRREFQSFFRMLQSATSSDNMDIQPHIEENNGSETIRIGPIVYGRITTMGPDGKVQTQEWSNLPEEARQRFSEQLRSGQFPMFFPPQPNRPFSPRQPTRPSPLEPQPPDQPFPGLRPEPKLKDEDNYPIDIFDTKEGYVTIFDTPATTKDEIDVKVKGRRLNLWIHGQLFRELELPSPVQLESIKFRNGVVEIHLKSNEGNEAAKQEKPKEETTQE
ncbi:MAG: hypothetical protein ACFFDP_00155 [Promethearchaeota archaeon]